MPTMTTGEAEDLGFITMFERLLGMYDMVAPSVVGGERCMDISTEEANAREWQKVSGLFSTSFVTIS
jgi:hypothetical protein